MGAPMLFRRLHEPEADALVRFTLDGRPASARRGDSVAAALLAEGVLAQRVSPVSGEARGPYCLMGVCFECLVTIDGVGNRQGCLIAVVDGMRVETGKGRRSLATEIAP